MDIAAMAIINHGMAVEPVGAGGVEDFDFSIASETLAAMTSAKVAKVAFTASKALVKSMVMVIDMVVLDEFSGICQILLKKEML